MLEGFLEVLSVVIGRLPEVYRKFKSYLVEKFVLSKRVHWHEIGTSFERDPDETFA